VSRIRVALADDHPVVLAGVKALLQSAPEMVIIGDATNGRDALQLFRDSRPDVAVLDISMPGLNGIEVARRLLKEAPDVRLLALSVHEDRAYVQPLLEAGAKGYLLKRSAADDLVRAIRAVAAGGIYLDPAVAGQAIGDLSHRSAGAAVSREALSERESEVLRLTAHGFSNKEIAARLEVSPKTVETYKARASEKLGLRTRAEIVRYAVAQGWLNMLENP
jgi:DNA-binding NarL/FixJ family response regulator